MNCLYEESVLCQSDWRVPEDCPNSAKGSYNRKQSDKNNFDSNEDLSKMDLTSPKIWAYNPMKTNTWSKVNLKQKRIEQTNKRLLFRRAYMRQKKIVWEHADKKATWPPRWAMYGSLESYHTLIRIFPFLVSKLIIDTSETVKTSAVLVGDRQNTDPQSMDYPNGRP